MNKRKNVVLLILTLLVGILIIVYEVFFRKPTYNQVITLKSDMTVQEVIHKLGRAYKEVGSGITALSYMLSDHKAAVIITFYQDRLINVVIHYKTGDVEYIIRPDYTET